MQLYAVSLLDSNIIDGSVSRFFPGQRSTFVNHQPITVQVARDLPEAREQDECILEGEAGGLLDQVCYHFAFVVASSTYCTVC